MGTRIKLDISQHEGKVIKGVFRISNPLGKEDTYHFTGTFENGNIQGFPLQRTVVQRKTRSQRKGHRSIENIKRSRNPGGFWFVKALEVISGTYFAPTVVHGVAEPFALYHRKSNPLPLPR